MSRAREHPGIATSQNEEMGFQQSPNLHGKINAQKVVWVCQTVVADRRGDLTPEKAVPEEQLVGLCLQHHHVFRGETGLAP
jgi:hypothetical protein